MASKKDLVEAQAFSRRRLLTAFVSGAPGGRELEPTKPMRAVVTGLILTVLVVLGSLGFGMLKPGLAAGWDDNTFVVADSGARFVALDGTLYPVLNTASARLLVSGEFRTIRTSDARIADAPRGATVGIPGAPDAVPDPDGLVADGWLSCIDAGGAQVTVLSTGRVAQAVAADQAAVERAVAAGEQGPPSVLVEVSGQEYVVTEGRRHLVPAQSRDAVLRALALATAQPWPVSAAWLSLFPPGADLVPLTLEGAGEALPGALGAPPGAVVGSVLRVTDAAAAGNAAWVIDADGNLAPLSQVALNLYRLGTGELVGSDLEVTSAQVAGLLTAEASVAPADWPSALPAPATGDDVCARLTTPGAGGTGDATVQLVPTAQDVAAGSGAAVRVDGNGGALVLPVAGGADATGWVHVVDASGTAYPLPADGALVLERLGYTADQVVRVPQEWLALFATGPALTVEAARATHGPGAVPTPTAPDAGPTETPGTTADAADVGGGDACTPGTPTLVADRPTALAQLGADGAWQLATGAGVTVAVVDSGVAAGNVHLTGAVVPGIDLVGGTDGRVDVDAHGTAVAGVVAARPVSGSGLVGLAPDATILPVRVYVDRSEESVEAGLGPRDDRLAEGIRAAADAGAQVINVSLSSPVDDPALADAVGYATGRGALVVASAGNRPDGAQGSSAPRYPAAYPEVLAVTAVDARSAPTDDVEHGPHVDLVAPGQSVLTTFLGDADCVLTQDEASSSYATAYASAAAALVAQRYPDETPAQWAHRLTVTAARPLAAERSDDLGWGVVRPWAALTFVDDGSAAGPASPVRPAPAPAPEPAPVTLSPPDDHGSDTRRAAAWWLLAAGVAGAAAALVGVPVRRRRTQGRLPGTVVGAVGPAGSTQGSGVPTRRRARGASRAPSGK